MKKTCLLSGNFALDTIVVREYPNGFVVGKGNKFVVHFVFLHYNITGTYTCPRGKG